MTTISPYFKSYISLTVYEVKKKGLVVDRFLYNTINGQLFKKANRINNQ